uniref:Protein FAM184A/B N-terminal domain-containing protein n=1 Tax=Eptatretus burgeri TaxID=7764 RepID=A0A8C4QFQ8_EPTBU
MAAASPGQGHGGAADSKQDMHFQMSKKLAQLTKVIYSLNTKNDKHEEEVQALKDAHTKELQQHATETRRHLLELQTKLGDQENMCKKLQNLENVLAKQERLRHEEKVTFDAYRRKMTREEARTLELERRVLAMKKDLQEKTEHFSRLRVRFADDKQAALKELSKVHQLEMEKARKDYDNEISAARQRLEELNDSEKSKEKINSCQSQSMEEPLEQEPSKVDPHPTKLSFKKKKYVILRWNLAVVKEKEAVNLRQLKNSQESLQVAREALDQQTELIQKASK